jgi:ketosteroid isomerase-like protein
MMNEQTILGARIVLGVVVTVFILLGGHPAAAQTTTTSKTDEQVLREIIQQENEGKLAKRSEDSIFVSGLLPRPIVGRQQREEMQSKMQEVSKRRPNQTNKTEMQRLVVAQSGDLAYDFGDFTVSYDAPDKKRTSFNGSYLRTWRKIDGEWVVDAFFGRPNEAEAKTKQK